MTRTPRERCGRGEHVVALRVPVFPGMADALRHWLRLLEEADELCHEGELLLPPSALAA